MPSNEYTLLKRLGLKQYGHTGPEYCDLGTVTVHEADDEGPAVTINVAVMTLPARCWRFRITRQNEGDDYRERPMEDVVMTTGSGALAEYWAVALLVAENAIAIEHVQTLDDVHVAAETQDTPCDCSQLWPGALYPWAPDGDGTLPWVEACDDCPTFDTDDDAARAVAAMLGGRVAYAALLGHDMTDPANLRPFVIPATLANEYEIIAQSASDRGTRTYTGDDLMECVNQAHAEGYPQIVAARERTVSPWAMSVGVKLAERTP